MISVKVTCRTSLVSNDEINTVDIVANLTFNLADIFIRTRRGSTKDANNIRIQFKTERLTR